MNQPTTQQNMAQTVGYNIKTFSTNISYRSPMAHPSNYSNRSPIKKEQSSIDSDEGKLPYLEPNDMNEHVENMPKNKNNYIISSPKNQTEENFPQYQAEYEQAQLEASQQIKFNNTNRIHQLNLDIDRMRGRLSRSPKTVNIGEFSAEVEYNKRTMQGMTNQNQKISTSEVGNIFFYKNVQSIQQSNFIRQNDKIGIQGYIQRKSYEMKNSNNEKTENFNLGTYIEKALDKKNFNNIIIGEANRTFKSIHKYLYTAFIMLENKHLNTQYKINFRIAKKAKFKIKKVNAIRRAHNDKNSKYREKAAKIVQGWWRKQKQKYQKILDKIIKIQSKFRGRFTRKYVYDIIYLSYLYQKFEDIMMKTLVNHVRLKVWNKFFSSKKLLKESLKIKMKNEYKIKKKLGEGGFGIVYLIEKNSQQYALKKCKLKLNNEEIEQYKKIINILSKLNNEHLIKYYDAFIENDSFNILMEYVGDNNLKQFIHDYKNNNELIDQNIIKDIFIQICKGLKEIHNNKILHRDLTPDNIIIDKNNKIKIGDFGISKILINLNNYANTQMGKIHYMAPERLRGLKYNNKVDIYIMMYII